MQHIRDITDPEHPYTLEQLNVVTEEQVEVDDAAGTVKVGGCGTGLVWRQRGVCAPAALSQL